MERRKLIQALPRLVSLAHADISLKSTKNRLFSTVRHEKYILGSNNLIMISVTRETL